MATYPTRRSVNITVKNLPNDMTKDLIRPFFKRFGKINLINVEGNGTALIEFQKSGSAEDAVTKMNNSRQNAGWKMTKNSFYRCAEVSERKADADMATAAGIPTFRHEKTFCETIMSGGICMSGDKCRFSHDVSTAGAQVSKTLGRKSKLLCKNIVLGGVCLLGDKCSYSHDATSGELKGRSKIPCKIYVATGSCTKGATCWFNHDVESAAADAKRKAEEEEIDESPKKTKKAKLTEWAPAVEAASTCAECTKGEPTVQCSTCEVSLCAACDATLHASRVMSKHVRTPIVQQTRCAECRSSNATVHCTKCDLDFCNKCSWAIHEFKVFRHHRREALQQGTTPKHAPVVEKKTTAPAAEEKAPVVQKSGRAMPKVELSDISDDDEPQVKAKPAAKAKPEVKAAPPAPVVVKSFDDSLKNVAPAMDDDSDFEDAKPMLPSNEKTLATTLPSDSSSDDDDEPAAAPAVASKPSRAMPKTELSDESESEDEAVPVKTQSAKKELSSEESDFEDAKPVLPSNAKTLATTLPSDSSSDEDDEPAAAAPAVASKPSRAMPKTELSDESESEDEAAPVKTQSAKKELSSEESDFEDAKPIIPSKASTAAATKPQPKTEMSSEDSSSDEDAKPMRPANQQKTTSTPAARQPKTELSSDESSSEEDAPVATKKSVSNASSHSLVKKIEEYAASSSTEVLHLSASLNGYERLLAHDTAERLGLAHESVGEGLERHITVSKSNDKKSKSWSKSRK
ncbi:unnamed protein product [Aphanomyces euteiches]